MERLSDLDELVLRCRTESARDYISEAVACYRSGAYRACIVSVWIAIVFDLVDKIRELSISGDNNAILILNKFEMYQDQINDGNAQGLKSALEFEREIVSITKEQFQFFDQQQLTDLSRLREDRHRCAHPSFQKVSQPYKPSAEQARLHLKNAIVHVLSQPPVQGKAALDELMRLVSSQYFPTERAQASEHLRQSPIARPNDALIRAFTDKLIYSFFEAGQPLLLSAQVVATLGGLLDMYRPIVEERIQLQINKISASIDDSRYVGILVLVFGIPEIWNLLSAPAKGKVINYLVDGPSGMVITFLKDAAANSELRDTALERIDQLNVDELSNGIINHELGTLAIPRALSFYKSVRSWNRANEVADKIIFPLFGYLSAENLDEILRMPMTNDSDLRGSAGFYRLIGKIRTENIFNPNVLNEKLRSYGLSNYIEEEGKGEQE